MRIKEFTTKFFLCFFVILVYGCKPKISNNAETLNKIFLKENIKVRIYIQGCFKSENYYFKLKKENSDYNLFYKKWKLNVKSDSVVSFKKLLLKKFNTKEQNMCTSTTYIKIGNYFNAVDYESRSCSDNLLNIIPFYKLIQIEDKENN